jgi:uncharacterized membrane protein
MTKVKKDIVVQAPVDTVYRAWHNFENFPRFMENIEEVRTVSGKRSHWKARGPLGTAPEWDAEMTLDEPNRAIGWRSIPGKKKNLTTAGRVNFEPMADATRLEVTIEYDAPAGPIGEAIAKIFSNPEHQIEEDLARFKHAIEQGHERSGFSYGGGNGGETLGGSLGPMTERDLGSIGASSAGVSPSEVDDPATRN